MEEASKREEKGGKARETEGRGELSVQGTGRLVVKNCNLKMCRTFGFNSVPKFSWLRLYASVVSVSRGGKRKREEREEKRKKRRREKKYSKETERNGEVTENRRIEKMTVKRKKEMRI